MLTCSISLTWTQPITTISPFESRAQLATRFHGRWHRTLLTLLVASLFVMTFAASLLGSSYIIFISICEGMSFSLFSPSITEQRCDQQPFLQKCRREKVCGKRPPCSSPTRHPKLCSTEERLAIIGVEGRENQLRQDIPRYQDFCML